MRNINGMWSPTITETGIYGFFSNYRFLSNFHPCTIIHEGITYPSSEHLYMALKVTDPLLRQRIASIPKASKARAEGQLVPLRPHWEDIKVAMMYQACYAKFSQNIDLREALLETGNKYLEETNYWADRIWGVCHVNGEPVGKNLLGKVLVTVREELRA